MTNAEADALIATLPKPGGLKLYRDDVAIRMEGGLLGGRNQLQVDATSGEQLLARWKDYVETDGLSLGPDYSSSAPATPQPAVVVGQWVSFPSKSAPSGWRKGQVVKVTGKRALIAFRFNYEKERARRAGLKFDPSTANQTWRKLTEIKTR